MNNLDSDGRCCIVSNLHDGGDNARMSHDKESVPGKEDKV